jgi:mono/diheme cytochrome c family protein
MTSGECKVKSAKCNMKTVSRAALPLLIFHFSLFTGSGCQQKMAEMPYYRPYEPTAFPGFADGRSARPLEPGTVHRGQRLDTDPLVTGLTPEEWARFWKQAAVATRAEPAPEAPPGKGDKPEPGKNGAAKGEAGKGEDRELAFGAPRYDPRKADEPKVYADAFPFEITADDLKRGQERYSIYCAICHGPLGNGKGKIWERGFLKPTSYHTEKVAPEEPDESAPAVPLGYSRGYARWGIAIPVREVPVGYIFEVITKGYGAMPDHAAQIPPADRWRIAAYVRVLQMSMHADPANLPPELREKVNNGTGPGGKTP